MKKCPKCGCEAFYVTAHVTQDWKVDSYGDFMDVVDDCVEVTHFPQDYDLWECAQCSYNDRGSEFNVKRDD